MDADTTLNLIALVAPLLIVVGSAVAYVHIQRALKHRAYLAELDQEPFHPMQLPTKERFAARNDVGQTPGQWFMECAEDARKYGTRQPSRLDYLREFHPERLYRRRKAS